MSVEDEARRTAQIDQARAAQGEAATVEAKAYAAFFKELHDSGMSEEHAFTLTHEWMVLTLSTAEPEEGE